MKITKLIIKNLHNVYNYEVNFNEDLTFLYGINGSGKTTILNIMASIVTGNIQELFKYNFESIIIFYKKNNEEKTISITSNFKNSNPSTCELTFTYEGNKYTFDRNLDIEDLLYRKRTLQRINLNRSYYNKYPFLKKIKEDFSYIYLPLNRNENYIDIDSMSMSYKNYNNDEKDYNIDPLRQVQALVKESVLKINNKVNKLNDNFRNQILTSTLNTYKNSFDIHDISKQIFKLTPEKIDIIKDSYINILDNLNLLKPIDKARYETFFNNYKQSLIHLSRGDFEDSEIIDLVIKYNEISKIGNIVYLANKMETYKQHELSPLEVFCNTVNEFLKTDTVENKEIFIDDKGAIRFHTKASKNTNGLPIEKLSSGEKQLLIFFANLIFRVNKNKQSIFIVDEPELSLHLAWQNIFVEKVMAINNNIQLIFATHSPEIIGHYRNKTNELKKVLGR